MLERAISVISGLNLPASFSPVAHAANVALAPALKWDTVATVAGYAVQVSTASSFI